MINEWWRTVSINDAYEVSNLGRMRRIDSGRILSPRPRRNGYISVSLVMQNGCQKRFYVHRLVAIEFCGGIPNGKEVNHLNFSKHDNRADNLEVVTRLQNTAHSKRAGKFVDIGKNSPRGEQSPNSKLTLKDVLTIRKLSERGVGRKTLAERFSVSKQQVKNVVLHRSWAHIDDRL
jgi:HNH endonuclease/NUMOD4 motif